MNGKDIDFFDFLPVSSFVTGDDGKIISWNKAAETLVGRSAEETIGMSAAEALGMDGDKDLLEKLLQSPQKSAEKGVSIKDFEGNELIVRVEGNPIFDSDENPAGCILCLCHDESKKLDKLSRAAAETESVIEEFGRIAQCVMEGDLSVRGDSGSFTGVNLELIAAVDMIIEVFIAPLNMAVDYVTSIAKGEIPEKIEDDYMGDFDRIKQGLNQCLDALSDLKQDMIRMASDQAAGMLDARCKPEELNGVYAEIAQGINEAIDTIINPMNEVIQISTKFSEGDLTSQLRELPGDQIALTHSINGLRENIMRLIKDSEQLVEAALSGELNFRADISNHKGGYREIIEGFNKTLDTMLEPVSEALVALRKLADFDLTTRMEGNYQGDHKQIKDSLNSVTEMLDQAMSSVSSLADQVRLTGTQIAQSSQIVAEGATEQASSLEETAASLEQISGMTRTNAGNTGEAQKLAVQTKEIVQDGSSAMSRMTEAMTQIKGAAESTAEIIRDINEIAFQTNLLALNAAVEAARAGDAGRGFAVVAEEVRNLAGRAKDAAKKTEELIKQSVNHADRGQNLSKEVDGNLGQIGKAVEQVVAIVGEIAVASEEQSHGVDQVNRAVSEMDQVVQRSAASSEESSSAAQDLAYHADRLAEMVQRFHLTGSAL